MLKEPWVLFAIGVVLQGLLLVGIVIDGPEWMLVVLALAIAPVQWRLTMIGLGLG